MKNALTTTLVIFVCSFASAAQFKFIAIGDTAYNGPSDVAVYESLIEQINKSAPKFSIHVGDIWGASVCSEERYREMLATFQRFQQPVIYTPGDNEWTDCNRYSYGDWDNVTRLKVLRKVFFAEASSLGETRIPLVRQSDISPYRDYVENSRWTQDDVLFLTLNVPGSGNNLQIKHLTALQEAHARQRANIAWLRDTFRLARKYDLAAVVVAIHAEILGNKTVREWLPNEYAELVREIQMAAARFAKPILLIHGDTHEFIIDRPFMQSSGSAANYSNITRLEVFGSPDIRAVQVSVDTDTPWVFAFSPFYEQ